MKYAHLDRNSEDKDGTPAEVAVYVHAQSVGDILEAHIPGYSGLFALHDLSEVPRLRSRLQQYVDGLANSATALFLEMNRRAAAKAAAIVHVRVPKFVEEELCEATT